MKYTRVLYVLLGAVVSCDNMPPANPTVPVAMIAPSPLAAGIYTGTASCLSEIRFTPLGGGTTTVPDEASGFASITVGNDGIPLSEVQPLAPGRTFTLEYGSFTIAATTTSLNITADGVVEAYDVSTTFFLSTGDTFVIRGQGMDTYKSLGTNQLQVISSMAMQGANDFGDSTNLRIECVTDVSR